MLLLLKSTLRKTAAMAACVVVLSLAACGYGFGPDTSSILEKTPSERLPTIKIKKIENPTMYPWLTYVIRSELRDELAARGVASWVDSGRADYEIVVKVNSFTIRSWITDPDDVTTLYSASLSLEGIIYSGEDNKEIWRSGNFAYSQSYDRVQDRVVAADLTQELIRRLISRLRRAF